MDEQQARGNDGEGPASPVATAQLSEQAYQQLKQMAHGHLRSYRPGMTLNCTALVHETYLKLFPGVDNLDGGAEGDHFLALASMAMRQILVDYVRQRNAEKRGGGAVHVTLQESLVAAEDGQIDLLELDAALQRLAGRDALLEQLVVMRFFAGLSMDQVANALGRSKRTVERDWTRARIYLFRELQQDHG